MSEGELHYHMGLSVRRSLGPHMVVVQRTRVLASGSLPHDGMLQGAWAAKRYTSERQHLPLLRCSLVRLLADYVPI